MGAVKEETSNGAKRPIILTGKQVAMPVATVAALLLFFWQFDERLDARHIENVRQTQEFRDQLGHLREDVDALETREDLTRDSIAKVAGDLAALEKRLMGIRDRIDTEEKYTRATLDGRIDAARRDLALLQQRVEDMHPQRR